MPECLKCINKITPIMALIFKESLARGDVPDEWPRGGGGGGGVL